MNETRLLLMLMLTSLKKNQKNPMTMLSYLKCNQHSLEDFINWFSG